jgi:predicted metal-dependent hydrolase
MHGREHRAFNELLEAQGLRSAPRRERGLKRLLGVVRKVVPARGQLAATCALEHFTAILAEMLLRDGSMRDDLHPSVRPLWLWHALEESEHKSVAFDVYRATGGGYLVRASIMVVTTMIFFAELAWVHASFARERGLLWRPWTWRGLPRMWLRKGQVLRTLGAYFAYFKPGFHPAQRDTDALLADWRERLFGERGEMAGQLRAA